MRNLIISKKFSSYMVYETNSFCYFAASSPPQSARKKRKLWERKEVLGEFICILIVSAAEASSTMEETKSYKETFFLLIYPTEVSVFFRETLMIHLQRKSNLLSFKKRGTTCCCTFFAGSRKNPTSFECSNFMQCAVFIKGGWYFHHCWKIWKD